MLFNSLEFLFIFLPLTLALFYTVRRFHYEAALGVLALASVVFYSYWNPPFVLLLLASVGVNFVLGQKLSKWALLPKARQRKKVVLTFGVAANLAAIGYFKYANFFLENISAMTGQDYGVLDDIFLPLGISFFTFQQIAYLVDCYKGVTKEYKFTHYALFVTFFPQLIAGPIVHHKDMMPQFLNPEKGNKLLGSIALGITVFCIGLFKKVVIADYMATLATPVFSAAERGLPVTFFEGWAAALAYTFQLYYDFSGYSDMAIGLGLLFGVKIPVNFFSPYKATSIIDFWRMWHITLSKFLKDYVYIPFGGNRYGEVKRMRNIMLTMLIGGLWHGAGWTFVIWGGLHGLYLVVNHLWRQAGFAMNKIFGWGLTFVAVVMAWVLFRAESLDGAVGMYKAMLGTNGVVLPGTYAAYFGPLSPTLAELGLVFADENMAYFGGISMVAALFSVLVLTLVMPNTSQVAQYKGHKVPHFASFLQWRPHVVWVLVSVALFFISLIQIWGGAASEFLYFQF